MVRRLLYINGLAITCVVLFHAAGMGFVAMFTWVDRYAPGMLPGEQIGSVAYYALRLVEQVVVFSIPAFMVVSGYFIAVATGRSQTTVGWRVVFSRIIYLVIPYLIWSFVTLGLNFLQGERYTPWRVLLALLTGRADEVLYFVPLLVQFYLISPFLVRWAKTNWKSMLLVTGLFQLLLAIVPFNSYLGLPSPIDALVINWVPKWFVLSRIFWFPLGIVIGCYPAEFKQMFFKYRWWLLGIAIATIPIGMIEWEAYFRLSGEAWLSHRETLVDNIYALVLILGILSFDRGRFPLFSLFSDLGPKSFGIFLTHALAIEYLAKIIYHVSPNLLAYQIVLQPAFITFGLGVPLLMMEVVNRSPLRRYSQYLFG